MNTQEQVQEQTEERDPRYVTNDEMIFLILFKEYDRITAELRSLRRRQTRVAREFVEHVMGKQYPGVYNLSPEHARYCAREMAKWLHEQIEKEEIEE